MLAHNIMLYLMICLRLSLALAPTMHWSTPFARTYMLQAVKFMQLMNMMHTTTLYRLVWATKVALAAICLVFPALVLGYESFNVSMYHVPVLM